MLKIIMLVAIISNTLPHFGFSTNVISIDNKIPNTDSTTKHMLHANQTMLMTSSMGVDHDDNGKIVSPIWHIKSPDILCRMQLDNNENIVTKDYCHSEGNIYGIAVGQDNAHYPAFLQDNAINTMEDTIPYPQGISHADITSFAFHLSKLTSQVDMALLVPSSQQHPKQSVYLYHYSWSLPYQASAQKISLPDMTYGSYTINSIAIDNHAELYLATTNGIYHRALDSSNTQWQFAKQLANKNINKVGYIKHGARFCAFSHTSLDMLSNVYCQDRTQWQPIATPSTQGIENTDAYRYEVTQNEQNIHGLAIKLNASTGSVSTPLNVQVNNFDISGKLIKTQSYDLTSTASANIPLYIDAQNRLTSMQVNVSSANKQIIATETIHINASSASNVMVSNETHIGRFGWKITNTLTSQTLDLSVTPPANAQTQVAAPLNKSLSSLEAYFASSAEAKLYANGNQQATLYVRACPTGTAHLSDQDVQNIKRYLHVKDNDSDQDIGFNQIHNHFLFTYEPNSFQQGAFSSTTLTSQSHTSSLKDNTPCANGKVIALYIQSDSPETKKELYVSLDYINPYGEQQNVNTHDAATNATITLLKPLIYHDADIAWSQNQFWCPGGCTAYNDKANLYTFKAKSTVPPIYSATPVSGEGWTKDDYGKSGIFLPRGYAYDIIQPVLTNINQNPNRTSRVHIENYQGGDYFETTATNGLYALYLITSSAIQNGYPWDCPDTPNIRINATDIYGNTTTDINLGTFPLGCKRSETKPS